jgi:glycosyltransferase involved in cell wall biosynthesis
LEGTHSLNESNLPRRRYRILILATAYPPDIHGVATVVRNLSEIFAEGGNKVTVVARSRRLARTTEARGLKVILFRVIRRNNLVISLRLLRHATVEAIKERPDLIHAHGTLPGLAATFVSQLFGIPFVISFHQDDLIRIGSERDKRFQKRISILIDSILTQRASSVLVPTRSLGAELRARLPIKVDKLNVIPYPVNKEFYSPPKVKDGIGKPYILCVGMLMKRKGVDILLRAFGRIYNELPELRLCLVGRGNLKAELKKLSASLGVEDRVSFEGIVPDVRLRALYHNCTVFVLPSRSELFGMAIAEAMAAGAPIIATRTLGAKSLITDGRNGIIVDIDDIEAMSQSIARLVRDSVESRRLGEFAREDALRMFYPDSVALSYRELFDHMTNSTIG